ncbi:MAG: aminoacyl-tRNA hydrolase [Deltaproteobacteria bacterium]|nr:aminoacyl-tRNA hydrolase [Deltaproteobacteria bacterium]
MRLLVGLGNPGGKYERTRHNVGFRVAEEVARLTNAALDQKRWSAIYGTGRLGQEQVAILLPQTFMNLSGEAVGQAARFWKVPANEVVVVHDELDFDFGRLAVKPGGGDGGHNGLKSIRQHLSGDTIRVRVGIGRPPPEWDPADWVLSKFDGAQESALQGSEGLIDRAARAAMAAMTEDLKLVMNRFNARK